MDWIVSKKKYDFVGKRALNRSDTIKKDRKQLVGLKTKDPNKILEEVLKTNYSVAQTIFIKIPILLIRNNKDNETISIDIHLNRSHAKYVYKLLIDGCKILNI